MGFFRQLIVQQWKNVLLQKRKLCITTLEILLPVFVLFIILYNFRKHNETVNPNPLVCKEESIVRVYQNLRLFNSLFRPNCRFSALKSTDRACEIKNHPIIYSPQNALTRNVMNKTRHDIFSEVITEYIYKVSEDLLENEKRELLARVMNYELIQGFDTKSALENFYKEHGGTHVVKPSVLFPSVKNSASDLLTHFKYQLIPWSDSFSTQRFHAYSTPNIVSETNTSTVYERENILLLQWLVAKSYIDVISDSNVMNVDMRTGIMTYLNYSGATSPITRISLAFALCTLVPVVFQAMGMVEEREKRLLEFSKMIGLSSAVHWTSWFIHGFLMMTVIVSILTAGLFLDLVSDGALYKLTCPTLFFVFSLAYSASVVSVSFFTSVLFKRPAFAGMFGCLVVFISVQTDLIVNKTLEISTRGLTPKRFACMHYHLAFSIGLEIINHYEMQGDGATWGNLSTPPTGDNFTLGCCLLMMLGDTFILLFITLYISIVWPGEYGEPQPIYFCFTKSYWCGTPVRESREEELKIVADLEKYFAPKPDLPVGIKIYKLQKDFANSRAVNISDLEMYEGEIFVLLGHNASGKSTFMSILSGFIPPSSGTAYMYGRDIRYRLKSVQKNVGLCPQFSVFFDVLTVEEHLFYFGMLQGNTTHRLQRDVFNMITDVGLAGLGTDPVINLSGGQKRKLSIAIAFINRSKVVILDEPTTGLDPSARHELWKMLRSQKEGRTILMSTKFMDEADALADRIAIMAESMVICCGPPKFLKKLYGTGCHLIIERTPDCHVERVTGFIKGHMPSATLKNKEKLELTYTLPDKKSSLIPGLLRHIEEKKKKTGNKRL